MATDGQSSEPVEVLVSNEHDGTRLDVFLTQQFSQYSRVGMRRIIQDGGVTVDGRRSKAAYRIRSGQLIKIQLVELPVDLPEPEDIPLAVLLEDEHLVAIDKPPGMVVHPSKGHWSGTLTAALAHHFRQLSSVGGPSRPGIVHRLDRDTSGVILVAKTDQCHLQLAAQFEARDVEKEYAALVTPGPDRDRDVIEVPIGAHPYQREKMAVRRGHRTSRDARTFFEVIERLGGLAHLRLLPKTGRTHQIRVHLAHIGCPVLCDRLYGGRSQLRLAELSGNVNDEQVLLDRQALHARRIRFTHPFLKKPMEVEAPLPDDFTRTLSALRRYRKG